MIPCCRRVSCIVWLILTYDIDVWYRGKMWLQQSLWGISLWSWSEYCHAPRSEPDREYMRNRSAQFEGRIRLHGFSGVSPLYEGDYGWRGLHAGLQSWFIQISKSRCRKLQLGHSKWNYCTRVVPHEIDLFLNNHSISHTEIIMMNGDDDPPSHFMIQSSQQVWSTAELTKLSEISLVSRLWGSA